MAMRRQGPDNPTELIEQKLLSRPTRQESFPISWSDWDFIKNLVGRCKARLDWWEIAASLFLGAAFSFLGIALTADAAPVVVAIYWAACLAAFLIAVACMTARWQLGRARNVSIDDLVEDMEQIERRYQRPVQS